MYLPHQNELRECRGITHLLSAKFAPLHIDQFWPKAWILSPSVLIQIWTLLLSVTLQVPYPPHLTPALQSSVSSFTKWDAYRPSHLGLPGTVCESVHTEPVPMVPSKVLLLSHGSINLLM